MRNNAGKGEAAVTKKDWSDLKSKYVQNLRNRKKKQKKNKLRSRQIKQFTGLIDLTFAKYNTRVEKYTCVRIGQRLD